MVQELESGEVSRAGVALKNNISATTLVKWHSYT
ncbi:hypothetical protein [Paenibacillus sp. PL91]|nr:hypothetical protein [Paenibacillus sp. PL91]